MSSLVILITSAIIVQYLVERVKDFIPTSAYEKVTTYVKPSVFSLVFALLISFGCKIGLFAIIGYVIEPVWIDYVLTAVALSGGAVGVNELIKSLQSVKTSNETIANSSVITEEIEEPTDSETEE